MGHPKFKVKGRATRAPVSATAGIQTGAWRRVALPRLMGSVRLTGDLHYGDFSQRNVSRTTITLIFNRRVGPGDGHAGAWRRLAILLGLAALLAMPAARNAGAQVQ